MGVTLLLVKKIINFAAENKNRSRIKVSGFYKYEKKAKRCNDDRKLLHANGFAKKLRAKKFEITFAIFRNSLKISNYVAFIRRRLIFISHFTAAVANGSCGMEERDEDGIYLRLK